MQGVVLAWLAGEGIIIYRSFEVDKRWPVPGQLLVSTGLFAALGLAARNRDAAFLAAALAWGFDIAAFMNIAPALTGDIGKLGSTTGEGAKTGKGKSK